MGAQIAAAVAEWTPGPSAWLLVWLLKGSLLAVADDGDDDQGDEDGHQRPADQRVTPDRVPDRQVGQQSHEAVTTVTAVQPV